MSQVQAPSSLSTYKKLSGKECAKAHKSQIFDTLNSINISTIKNKGIRQWPQEDYLNYYEVDLAKSDRSKITWICLFD